MKKVIATFALFITAIVYMGCGTKSDPEVATTDTTQVTYAYTIDQPDGWEWGSKHNTEMVMNALKNYETGNIEECVKSFGDSVLLQFDNYEAKVSNDSLMAMFTRQRSQLKSLKVFMNDFESVKSKDGTKQYVSLWYKEVFEGSDGKKDSLSCMDDLKIENGKIVGLDEKSRHYMK